MKKVLIAVGIIAVAAIFVYASTSNAGWGNQVGNAVGSAVNKAANAQKDADYKSCKSEIYEYHQNIKYNTTNGGPGKITAAFDGGDPDNCKISSNKPNNWRARCDKWLKSSVYMNASCNKNNCSLYCYK